MTRINTNVASLRGLRNLQNTSKSLNTSLTRLSTGLQINSGKDNPSGLIASETLRLQVTAIEQSIKNSNRANNVIATADSALGEISNLLNQIRGLVQEGLNSGALSQDEIQANQLQIDTALSAINRIAANTTFAGDKLIDGSKAFNTQVSSADAAKLSDFKINEALFGSNSTIEVAATINTAATQGQLYYNAAGLSADTTLEVSGSKGRQVLFLGASSTTANVRDAINDVTDITGVRATILNGATLSTGANAGTVTVVSAGNDNDVTFTDARATATQGAFAESISIVFADPGANDANLTVAVTQDANDNYTITVSLATDNNGAITSTADDIVAAIANDADASALVTAVASEGDGSGVVEATAAPQTLSGGHDGLNNDVAISDIRPTGSAGTVSVVFADPGSNSASLSVAVTSSGNDRTITVNLATDANGNIISTAADVAAAINADATASALVHAVASGDGSETVSAIASTDLAAGGGVLRLESVSYGSKEFVDLNVLSGSFATTLSDFTTSASRNAGSDIVATINGQQAQGQGLTASVRTSTLDASLSFAAASNVANASATVTITGGGSLFQIGQEVSAAGQIGVGIDAVNTARLGGVTGKLYELGTGGGKSLLDVGPNVQGADLVAIVEEALDRVSTLRGRLGAIQKNVIETNISTLGVALENITDARSEIIDTDFAIETANLTRAQILSQAGISVLSIANQNPAQVLALLG